MASKQDNYLRMHHPSIWKGMKKGGKVEDYAKGGKVKYYAQGGRNTDTVPAMLTPGEVVLNEEQQIAIGNMMAGGGKVSEGQAKADALFKHIGVPGFKGGGIAGLFEKGRVLSQDFRHRRGEEKEKRRILKETGVKKKGVKGFMERSLPGGESGYEPRPPTGGVGAAPPLARPQFAAEDPRKEALLRSIQNKSMYVAQPDDTRVAIDIDKKYNMGGKVCGTKKKKKKKQKRGY